MDPPEGRDGKLPPVCRFFLAVAKHLGTEVFQLRHVIISTETASQRSSMFLKMIFCADTYQ
jgi:hypothetical protein